LRYEECSGIGKKKILIVDDNSDLRKLLALVLKNSDYDTTEAARVDRFSNLFCVASNVGHEEIHENQIRTGGACLL
jgi:response regulator RpfG family c-di-GMP phosphodiesterase